MTEIAGSADGAPGIIDLRCSKCEERRDKPLTQREQAAYWMREATYQRGRADALRCR